jgi:hypothetical protein
MTVKMNTAKIVRTLITMPITNGRTHPANLYRVVMIVAISSAIFVRIS